PATARAGCRSTPGRSSRWPAAPPCAATICPPPDHPSDPRYGAAVPYPPGEAMPHELTELKVKTVTKPAGDPAEELSADVCVVGAGIAGLSAAIEARKLGRSVVLADALPVLGGQCVN